MGSRNIYNEKDISLNFLTTILSNISQNTYVQNIFILYKNDDVYIYGTRGVEKIHKDDHERIYNLSQYFNYPYINHEDLHNTPSWVKDTVWYQIFPDRFNGVNNQSTLNWNNKVVKITKFMVGTYKVLSKIPHLKELASGIYFTPSSNLLCTQIRYERLFYNRSDFWNK